MGVLSRLKNLFARKEGTKEEPVWCVEFGKGRGARKHIGCFKARPEEVFDKAMQLAQEKLGEEIAKYKYWYLRNPYTGQVERYENPFYEGEEEVEEESRRKRKLADLEEDLKFVIETQRNIYQGMIQGIVDTIPEIVKTAVNIGMSIARNLPQQQEQQIQQRPQIQAEEFATAFLAWLTKNVLSKKLESEKGESSEKKRKVKLKIKGEKDVEESAEKAG